jgi:hypothetical protein
MMNTLDRSLTITNYAYYFVKHTITQLFMNLSYDICFVSCIYKYTAYEKNNVSPLVGEEKRQKVLRCKTGSVVPATSFS